MKIFFRTFIYTCFLITEPFWCKSDHFGLRSITYMSTFLQSLLRACLVCISLDTSHLLLRSYDLLLIPLSRKHYLKTLSRFEKDLPSVGTISPKLSSFDLYVK